MLPSSIHVVEATAKRTGIIFRESRGVDDKMIAFV